MINIATENAISTKLLPFCIPVQYYMLKHIYMSEKGAHVSCFCCCEFNFCLSGFTLFGWSL